MIKSYVGICPICFKSILKGKECKVLEEGYTYHTKCIEQEPDYIYLIIEKVYSQLWKYNELWIECGNFSNCVKGLEYKQKLLKYLMIKHLIKDICFYKGKVEFKINDMAEFNKVNVYCNKPDDSNLIYSSFGSPILFNIFDDNISTKGYLDKVCNF